LPSPYARPSLDAAHHTRFSTGRKVGSAAETFPMKVAMDMSPSGTAGACLAPYVTSPEF